MLSRILTAVSALVGPSPPHEEVPRSPLWPKVRAEFLRTHPACAACGRTAGLTPHHVYPVSWPGGRATELDAGNLIALCESPTMNCHLWVGHLGDFKARNPNVVADAAAVYAKVHARPYPAAASDDGKR